MALSRRNVILVRGKRPGSKGNYWFFLIDLSKYTSVNLTVKLHIYQLVFGHFFKLGLLKYYRMFMEAGESFMIS